MKCLATLLIMLGLHSHAALADETMAMMHHGSMMMDEKGMIMNANSDNLPKDCPKISGDVNITIHAGQKHALKFPGKMFAFDNQEWDVKPCSRINITFINDDQIRHQLMIHGLPGYIYPQGMFHLELYGQGELKASLIVPSQKKNLSCALRIGATHGKRHEGAIKSRWRRWRFTQHSRHQQAGQSRYLSGRLESNGLGGVDYLCVDRLRYSVFCYKK